MSGIPFVGGDFGSLVEALRTGSMGFSGTDTLPRPTVSVLMREVFGSIEVANVAGWTEGG
jgi:hypothetical protein